MKKATIGTLSHGTLRNEDLLPAFTDELESLDHKGAHKALILNARDADPEDEEGSEILCELIDALNELAPSYCYFGAHPGDGSDFGFWPYDDILEIAHDEGIPVVKDLSEVDRRYAGTILIANDRGNLTCGNYVNEEFYREWSIV